MKLNREIMVHVAETSIIETIEAFGRFRPSFHGDTGIRDYLYHRLVTGLPDGGTHTRPNGGGTLLAQAEWYTVLECRNTGNSSSRGRFDIGIADPEELHSTAPRPLMKFECGRNRYVAVLLGDVDAAADHEGLAPADITKLAREINHAGLPLGYALEFYDEDHWEAERLIERVREWISTSQCDGLRIVVLSYRSGERPSLTFLPKSWNERLRLEFGAELMRIEALSCARTGRLTQRSVRAGERYANRVSNEARTHQERWLFRDFSGWVGPEDARTGRHRQGGAAPPIPRRQSPARWRLKPGADAFCRRPSDELKASISPSRIWN